MSSELFDSNDIDVGAAIRRLHAKYHDRRRHESLLLFGHTGASVAHKVPQPQPEDEARAVLEAYANRRRTEP